MTRPLVLFGTAEIAELARFYFEHDSEYRVVAFTVDDAYVDSNQFLGLPVVPFSEVATRFSPEENELHVALSYSQLNRLRQEKYLQAKTAGYRLASYISTKSTMWPGLVVGDNCFILENQCLQPAIRIGSNVVLWSGNHIGHGSAIGDHTYVSSHVVISGHCEIGERCFFGVNATIKDFTRIGDECFIGMAASVTSDMASGSVAIGESARIFPPEDRIARALKKKYFKI
jgi:sugar O-acyltransferase (sialic acid O-acetyltransferase NeuD family)